MENTSIDKGNRLYFLDNLRTFMIFLVVVVHTALIYEKSAFPKSWWIVFEGSNSDLPGLLFFIMDIFVMSVIFFISGFLTPKSLNKKTTFEFIKVKFKRLIIPWLIAVFTLIPVYKFIFLYSRNLPQQDWQTYFYFSSGFSQSWLWFLPVLFMFDLIYLALNKIKLKLDFINIKTGVFLVLVVSIAYGFTVDILGLKGWTKTFLIDFQNERLLSYFTIFLLGSLCFKLGFLKEKPKSKTLYYVMNGIAWLPMMLYLTFFFYPYLNEGKFIFSKNIHTFLMWSSFHISVLSILYIFIITFQLYFNKQGKIGKELNQNSYNVYIIHMGILGIIASLLLNVSFHPLLKFLTATFSTWIVCNIFVSIYQKLKFKVLKKVG